jgi:alpha-L-rhamnosidase
MSSEFDRREFPLDSGVATVPPRGMPTTLRASATRIRVVGLTADHLDRPLGLQNAVPELSWRLESDQRNIRQRAYRVLVSSSEAALDAGQGDLWDSGEVRSTYSSTVAYHGRPLVSRQRCWWCVYVWIEGDAAPAQSSTSWWEMALLRPEDWVAQWLAAEDRIAREDREVGLNWIWGDAPPDVPSHRFRFLFELPEAAAGGELIVAVKQSFWWSQITRIWLDGVALAGPGRWIESFPAAFDAPTGTTVSNLSAQHVALNALRAGRHVLAVEISTRPVSSWYFASVDTPANVPGLSSLCRLELESGGTLRLKSGADWKTNSDERVEEWHQLGYDDGRWTKPRVDAGESHQPWPAQPAMQLRQTFNIDKPATKARLYVTALGTYEARLNGTKVGDALLTPGPSQYDKRVLYQAFDVGSLLRCGRNAIGLIVADGWYASYDGRFAWADPPRRVIAQLELTYEDGSQQIIKTGPGWRIAESSVRMSQVKVGEISDNRLEQPGWDSEEFDDSHWQAAGVAKPPACRLMAQNTPPIRVDSRLVPQVISRTQHGDYVVDFGICFAGWCELRVIGGEGARIELKYSELLKPSGEVDQSGMALDPCGEPRRDVFFLRGDQAGECLSSRFVYRGLRYVQISGLASAPASGGVAGVFIHSDLEETGTIHSGDGLVENIFDLVRQTQKSNFVAIPVDNNTREVRGYNGEMAIFGETACYLMDVRNFFSNHVDNTVDGQAEDGSLPIYAPRPRYANLFPQAAGDAPGWGDTVIWLAWQCWRHYGDTALIERNWEAMNRFSRFVVDNNPHFLWLNKRVFDFGDWLSFEPTPNDLFATAIWARSTAHLAEMAAAVGRREEAARLIALRARIQDAFITEFIKADGTIGNGSQTSYALSLAFDLVPHMLRTKAASRLAAAIRKRSPQGLTTGTWGTRFILDVLADTGHPDLAYDLVTSTSLPSWGYMVRRGATAVWEKWDGETGTLNQPGLGSIGGFLFKRFAGIEPGAPGFEKVIVRLLADPRLRSGGGEYRSVRGLIATDWQRPSDGEFVLEVAIPPNTNANIHLPARPTSRLMEGGEPILGRPDLFLANQFEHETVIAVGSGTYRFSVSS